MKFVLHELPYAYSSLEPYIDAMTMEIHYTKHYQAYLTNLNAALEKYPDFQSWSADKLVEDVKQLPEGLQMPVRNNGGGYINHTFFWQIMSPDGGGEPRGRVGEEIKKIFGSFAAFQELFNAEAKKVFGSGWAWLVVDKSGKLQIISTPNQDSPLMQGIRPIMGLDVWEHAYYLKYQNRRPDYINAWWHVVNWDQVQQNWDSLHE
jgi:Fe-Mn family superoxide dismutase